MTIDRARVLAQPAFESPYRYGARDAVLYALSIGLGSDPMDLSQLRFVYDEELVAFPSMVTTLGWVDRSRDPALRDPALGIDPDRVVVAETALQMHRPLDSSGQGWSRAFNAQVCDQGPGKNAFVLMRREIVNADREPVATVDTWLAVRGAGGFGGPAREAAALGEMPRRAPDAVHETRTPGNIAFLHRLSLGDRNALHVDPRHAARVGFERPVVHGSATFGLSLHAALHCAAAGDVRRFRSAAVRFVKPVFPGETIRTEVWMDAGTVRFRCSVVERGIVALDRGEMVLAD